MTLLTGGVGTCNEVTLLTGRVETSEVLMRKGVDSCNEMALLTGGVDT